MRPEGSRFRSGSDMRRRWRNSNRQSRSIPNSFEAHYFYARACFAQGKFERAAALFERAAEIKPDDYQILVLLIAIYRSLGRDRDKENAARRGIERAERELTLHPENPRPAYHGR